MNPGDWVTRQNRHEMFTNAHEHRFEVANHSETLMLMPGFYEK